MHAQHKGVHLYLRNASQLPVYDMTASFTYNTTPLGTVTRQVLRPSESVEEVTTAWETMGEPNHKVVEYTTHSADGWELRQAEAQHVTISLQFRDSQNRWWQRSEDGTLRESQDGTPREEFGPH
jgi:hypothetical protein